jgi:hypothetical protein
LLLTTPPESSEHKKSGRAVASLILGLLSFLPLVGVLAVIFGHGAKASIRRSERRLSGKGMATAGLVLGYGSVVVWIFLVIVFCST